MMLNEALKVTGYGLCKAACVSDSNKETSGDSLLVKIAVQSIRAALLKAGWASFPLPSGLSPGIAYLSPCGDGQVEHWAYQAHKGNLRPSPKRFGGLVHNSAAGRAAIEFGLIGPQIAIVSGDLLQMAKLQLLCGKTEMMIACAANEVRELGQERLAKPKCTSLEAETIAFSLVVERIDNTTKNSKRSFDVPRLQLLEEGINSEKIQHDIDVFWKQWGLAKGYMDKHK